MQRTARMKKEIDIFQKNPPHGITCWQKGDNLDIFEAQIIGSEGTPYEEGIFKLEINIPERYPFEPPKIHFLTPVYHPNIDTAGRICLDNLKMPPKGAWRPALNISTVLTSIQLLMNEPNPDDPLMTEISNEFKYNRPLYIEHAKAWTQKYAVEAAVSVKKDTSKENMSEETAVIVQQKRSGNECSSLLDNKRLKVQLDSNQK